MATLFKTGAYQPVQDALSKVKDLSADSEARRLAFVRERALHDEVSQINAATEEGIAKGIVIGKEEGIIEGVAKGKTEGKIEQTLHLLNLKFGELPEWVEAKLNSATEQQLDQWTVNFLHAETLEQVFEAKSP